MESPPSDPSQLCWLASLPFGESVWPWVLQGAVAFVVLWFAIRGWHSGQLKKFWEAYWPALREFGIVRVIILVVFLGLPGYLISFLNDKSSIFSNQFVQNYIAEMWAAFVLIVVSYFFRHYIKRFVDRLFSPTPVRIRLPLMTATAPIIIGLKHSNLARTQHRSDPRLAIRGSQRTRRLGRWRMQHSHRCRLRCRQVFK